MKTMFSALAAESGGERGLLAVVPLGAQEDGNEVLVARVLLLGLGDLVVEDLGDLGEVEAPEQLLDLVIHLRGLRAGRRRVGRSRERCRAGPCAPAARGRRGRRRSEEHTSEL